MLESKCQLCDYYQKAITRDRTDHRHGIDKYPDTLLVSQKRKVSPPIIPKVAIARWWTAPVIISLTCLTNHSEADRRR